MRSQSKTRDYTYYFSVHVPYELKIAQTHPEIYTYTHVYTYTDAYTYTNTYTHTYTHTHTHINKQARVPVV